MGLMAVCGSLNFSALCNYADLSRRNSSRQCSSIKGCMRWRFGCELFEHGDYLSLGPKRSDFIIFAFICPRRCEV